MNEPIVNPTLEQLRSLRGVIYAIRHKLSNRFYIGQTRRTFVQRYPGGWWKTVSSIYLQRAVAKYGKDSFEIWIIEHSIDSDERLGEREIHYAQLHNAYAPAGYNILGCGGKKKAPTPPELRWMMGARNAKDYTFKHLETGEIFEIHNLSAFCREKNLHHSTLLDVIKGKGKMLQYQGYAALDTDKDEVDNAEFYKYGGKRGPFTLWKGGVEYRFTNVKTFVKEHDLCSIYFNKLMREEVISHRGFTLNNIELKAGPKWFTDIKVVNVSGEVKVFKSSTEFAIYAGLSKDIVPKLVKTGRKTVKEWTLLSFREIEPYSDR